MKDSERGGGVRRRDALKAPGLIPAAWLPMGRRFGGASRLVFCCSAGATSEVADEVLLDLVDANLTWAQTTDRGIPLMEMVYSRVGTGS